MKKIFCLLILVFCAGCGVTVEELDSSVSPVRMPEAERRFISLRQVRNGMTREEVKGILAMPVVIGYELSDPQAQQYKPLTMNNPQRSEVLRKGAKSMDIDYYLTGIQNQDGKITDDELTPLVFYDNKLVGSGWEYLKQLKAP